MSTKGTLAHGIEWHLFDETISDEIWLELNRPNWIGSQNGIALEIPRNVIEAIVKCHNEKKFPYQSKEN